MAVLDGVSAEVSWASRTSDDHAFSPWCDGYRRMDDDIPRRRDFHRQGFGKPVADDEFLAVLSRAVGRATHVVALFRIKKLK